MSPRQWHAILPSGAFSSSALAEDLAPALEQARYFGKKHILLASDDCKAAHFPRLEQNIFDKGLAPQRLISLEEFAVSEEITGQIERGYHFVLAIDREPSAAAIEKMISTKAHLARFTYVVIGRKDWRFKDAYRSLPHFVRPRLHLDFPVSIHHSDPFYSPAEVGAILDELNGSSGFAAPVSFSPHFGLRRELLRANIIAVSGPETMSGPAPKISVVTTNPEAVNRLASLSEFSELAAGVEFVVSRVIGQQTVPVHPVSVPVFHVWLHLEDSAGAFPEIGAELRNWGAQYARGKFLLFADEAEPEALATLIRRVLFLGEGGEEIVRAGEGMMLASGRFREAGGFDPLFFRFGLGEAELLHRYLGGLSLATGDLRLADYLRRKIKGAHRALGAGLFFHQYFDETFLQYFSPSASETVAMEREGGSRLRNQVRYRLEQSRDAYLGIYKASPRVALEGHVQILLKPYHWIKPYAWLLKMPVYPLIVQPYHRIKLHAWLLKMPVYPLVVQPYHFLRLYAWRPFREHAWRVKYIYYFAKVALFRLWGLLLRVWGLLLRLYGLLLRLRGQLWRIKQVYYFFFRLLFPIRKIYYFAEYQFEKRILGLYGRQHVWIKK